MAIHMFLSDQTLVDPTLQLVNLEELNLRCGYLDRTMAEHFVSATELRDRRQQRMAISYRNEYPDIIGDEELLQSIYNGIIPAGYQHIYNNANELVTIAQFENLDLMVFHDENVPTEPVALPRDCEFKLTLDRTKLTTSERDTLSGLNDDARSRLFNIIEYVTYGTLSTDTQVDINASLSGSPDYSGYVTGSISVPNRRSMVFLHSIGVHRILPRRYSFRFIYGGVEINFTVWVDRQEFIAEYPHTTIINVVPPLPLPTLLDPSSITGSNIEISMLSRQLSNDILDVELKSQDQTGMLTFPTRYIHQGQTYYLPFSVVYRGKVPDDGIIRQHIYDYLLSSGVGTPALWMTRLPDIFVVNTFFMIPMWDQISELTNHDIFPSILDLKSLQEKVTLVKTTLPQLTEVGPELVTVAWGHLFTVVLARFDNEEAKLLNLHPTYRDYSTSDGGFIEMSPHDQEWSIRINQAMAIAHGEVNTANLSIVTIGGYQYLSLIWNYRAYNVMLKQSYLQLLSDLSE